MQQDLYDGAYYRSLRGHGDDRLYRRILRAARIEWAGKTILDVGCGRGEMIRLFIELGAVRVVGVDSSPAGVELARRNLSEWGVDPARYELICADAGELGEETDTSFDCVAMIDFVEHISQDELRSTLKTMRRVLKDDGTILIHTFPNRHLHRLLCAFLGVFKPRERDKIESIHVNVQTAGSLASLLRESGFRDCRIRLENDLIFASSFYQGMRSASLKRLARFLFYDISCIGFFDRLIRLSRLDRVFYMSIYGVARS